jgi:hypothetical protein
MEEGGTLKQSRQTKGRKSIKAGQMHSDDEFAQKTERLQIMANSDQIFFFFYLT